MISKSQFCRDNLDTEVARSLLFNAREIVSFARTMLDLDLITRDQYNDFLLALSVAASNYSPAQRQEYKTSDIMAAVFDFSLLVEICKENPHVGFIAEAFLIEKRTMEKTVRMWADYDAHINFPGSGNPEGKYEFNRIVVNGNEY